MISGLARGLERVVCAIFRTPTVSDLPRSGHGLSASEIKVATDRARYFAIGNALKLAGFALCAVSLMRGPVWALSLTLLFACFHLLITLSEWVRIAALRNLVPDATPNLPATAEVLESFAAHLNPWETPRLYQALGIEAFRRLVVKYERITYGGSVQNVSRANLIAFAKQTCEAEISHSIAFLMDWPPLLGLCVIKSPLIAIPGLMALLDFLLILLQRAHRVRLRRVLT